MDAQDIIIRPIITEKSMNGAAMKKYTFEVAKNAEKIQIKGQTEKRNIRQCVPILFRQQHSRKKCQ